MASKRTPGIWDTGPSYSVSDRPIRQWQVSVFSGNKIVAYACGETKEEAEANAKLIVILSEMAEIADKQPTP